MSEVPVNPEAQTVTPSTAVTPDPAPPQTQPVDSPPAATAPAAPAYIAESDDAGTNNTPFKRPEQEQCPNCSVGVLYVTAYDDKALHEVGQPIYAPSMLSGGSVTASCFNCGYSESFPLNPREAPVNPNPGT